MLNIQLDKISIPHMKIGATLVSLLIIWPSILKADWINLTGAETSPNIAEIYILDDQVRVKLEVYVGDLDKFEELLPDEWYKDSVNKRPSLNQRMELWGQVFRCHIIRQL